MYSERKHFLSHPNTSEATLIAVNEFYIQNYNSKLVVYIMMTTNPIIGINY